VLFNALTLVLIFRIVIYHYYLDREVVRKSETKYRHLFENMTVGFALHEIICDAKGKPVDYRYLEVNPAFEKLTGIPIEKIVGKTISELKPGTEDYWIEVFGSVALTGKPRAYVNFSKELGRYYDTWTFQPAPGQFAVVFSDITEKKLAEIKIAEQARLLDEAKDAIAVIGLDGKFTFVNEAWARMHGHEKREMLGQDLAFVHTPEQFKACEHLKEEVMRLGRVQMEVGHKRKDGSTFPVWLSVSEVRDADNRLTGFLGIANDITERKAGEEKLRRSEERLNTIFQKNPVAMSVSIFETGEYCYVNESMLKLMRATDAAEMTGKRSVDIGILAPADRERLLRAAGDRGRVDSFVTPMRRLDGEEFFADLFIGTYEQDGRRYVLASIVDVTDRLKLTQALGETQAYYKTLLATASDGIHILDIEGNLVEASAAFYRMLGHDPAHPPKLKVSDWDAQWSLEELQHRMARHFIEPQTVFETLHRRVSGELFPVEISTRGVLIDGRKLVYAASRDITERKKAESALRLHELALQQTNDGIAIMTLDGRITFVNEAWARMHAYEKSELIGQSLETCHTREQMVQCVEFNQRVLEHGHAQAEIGHRRKDGSTFPTWMSVSLIKDAAGQVTSLVGIANDISQRKLTEAKIQEQARLIDEARESIVLRDLQGCIHLWNLGAENIFGWRAEEAIGKTPLQLGQYAAAEFEPAMAQVMEKGIWAGEFLANTRDGRQIDVESRWTLVRDEAGRPQKILSISHDITSQKKMEAQLMRAERLQTIGTLSSGVAHDLNNIFAPFLVGLPILREEIRTRETRDLLDLMENSIHRGADIVRQLLLFGRGGEFKRIPLNPGRTLRDVAKIIRETFPKNIALEVSCPDDLWSVSGDATQIYQVLLNLAINARDAMPDGGALTLTAGNVQFGEDIRTRSVAAKPGPYVMLSVGDNGSGMSPEVLKRVFEPFYTTKDIGKGTGLGLSVAIGVVESHGGFIQVQSTPGSGSEFKVHLPALPVVENEAGAAPPPVLPRGDGDLILLVDDEPAILRVVAKILERNGYQPLTAHNGTEGMRIFLQNRHKIRLVITDFSMPGMNGGVFAEAVRQINPGLPIILASGLGDALDVEKLRESGIRVVLKKPFNTEVLLNTLKTILAP